MAMPTPPKRGLSRNTWIGIGLVGAFGLIAVIGRITMGTGAEEPASIGPTSSAPTSAPTPSYRLEVGAKPSSLEVYIDRVYSESELAAIVGELQSKYAVRDDGYFVRINCAYGSTDRNDNRLANAKFAVGPIGAARTGLADGEREITLVEGAECPPSQLPSAPPDAVSAKDVVDAVISAGLPAGDPRDNTARRCAAAGCVQLITTDEFSAYQFPDNQSAERWASMFPSHYVNGTIFLRFTESGSMVTDPALIPQYRAVLDQLMTNP